FRAEDGIRVFHVTGVQTCALPILRADFALRDVAALGRVHDLDRVLDGDDVILAALVEVIDHGGEGRGLARANRTGDQDQPVVKQIGRASCRETVETRGWEARVAGR